MTRKPVLVPELKKSDYEALGGLRKALRQFLRFSEDSAREIGLTPQQHQLLLAIMSQPGKDHANLKEIADFLQLKHQTVVGLTDRCETAGLVRRESSTVDKRRVNVYLQPKGLELLAKLSQRNMEELRAMRKFLKPAFLDPK